MLKEILNQKHNPIRDLIAIDPQFALEMAIFIFACMGVVGVVGFAIISRHWPEIKFWLSSL